MGICARVLAWVLASVRGCMAVVEKVVVRFLLPFFHSALVAIFSLRIVASMSAHPEAAGSRSDGPEGDQAFSQAPL